MVQFGDHLRQARLESGLTQADVANRLSVSKGYISRLETGKARPAEATVRRLAQICETDPDPLLILADYLPADLREILSQHPVEVSAMLRGTFGRTAHPQNVLSTVAESQVLYQPSNASYQLIQEDCFAWLEHCPPNSVHAIVTDPPYGLKEYTTQEKDKLRRGRGGVWRIPPSLDGCVRQPLPRFTVLSNGDKQQLTAFFGQWGERALRVLVPGGHVFIAANPLLSHLVYAALVESGFEKRGEIIRLVQTLRGGDRPKNAHDEFADVTVMPRSGWEPWGLFRKPCEGRVQDNLRVWKTGGLRRSSPERPFGDVIRSAPTRPAERAIAPHPSLKPQSLMRQIVRAALPLGEGIVLDPFMGGGSTIAAACAVGYESIGIESDSAFFEIAKAAIPQLATLEINEENKPGPTAERQPSLFG